jgi:hypothetical protein
MTANRLWAIRQALESAGIVFTGHPTDELVGIVGKARSPQPRAAEMTEKVKGPPPPQAQAESGPMKALVPRTWVTAHVLNPPVADPHVTTDPMPFAHRILRSKWSFLELERPIRYS